MLVCICWHGHVIFILHSVKMVYCIDCFCILSCPCIKGLNPTWSWCLVFLICCWIPFSNILLSDICTYIYREYWPIVFSLYYLCLALLSEQCWTYKGYWNCSTLNYLGESLGRIDINSFFFFFFEFLNFCYESPLKPSGLRLFFGDWLLFTLNMF